MFSLKISPLVCSVLQLIPGLEAYCNVYVLVWAVKANRISSILLKISTFTIRAVQPVLQLVPPGFIVN